ncbi:hypothetical protein SKAU_G00390900 [Synaphobranchus kaupii]|uniref:Uncharacterized protein n=1 Tax=Synaphobranchus kaupii TaxID=118154 RepID=A0A9Q1EBH1_SYNKA|nr:hypothetical protein SKAU_G00390900 [Synaphobranchus kaupii]
MTCFYMSGWQIKAIHRTLKPFEGSNPGDLPRNRDGSPRYAQRGTIEQVLKTKQVGRRRDWMGQVEVEVEDAGSRLRKVITSLNLGNYSSRKKDGKQRRVHRWQAEATIACKATSCTSVTVPGSLEYSRLLRDLPELRLTSQPRQVFASYNPGCRLTSLKDLPVETLSAVPCY